MTLATIILHSERKPERQQKRVKSICLGTRVKAGKLRILSTKQLITLMFISLEARATFETTPVVMVLERLSGEPMATTNSPGRRSLEDPGKKKIRYVESNSERQTFF